MVFCLETCLKTGSFGLEFIGLSRIIWLGVAEITMSIEGGVFI